MPTPKTPESTDEWTTVVHESAAPIYLNEGDQFVGVFEGIEHIDPDNGKDDPFDLVHFRKADGNLGHISQYKVLRAARDLTPGTTVRLTRMPDVDTGKGNPMIDYRIDVRK